MYCKSTKICSLFLQSSFLTDEAAKKDEVTHTGQSWDEKDLRSLRFMNKTKETNTMWAIDLIAKVPPILVDKRVVACDGGSNPALGHPKVYINLDSHEPKACIYCGLRYQFKGH